MSPRDRPARRELPPHMAAQLRGAGGATDSGGQPWAGRDPAQGHSHLFSADDGAADLVLARALDGWRAGELAEADVVAALADTRLFVPVMAEVTRSEITDEGLVADKEADMSLVTLQAADGRKAQPVFTSDALVPKWHHAARPVAAQIRKIAIAAVKDGTELLVLDPGSEAPFVVRRPALWAVAKAETWVPSYADPGVSRAVLQAALGLDGVAGASVRPGRGVGTTTVDGAALEGGGTGPELTVVLQLLPGMDRGQLETVVGAFQARLAEEQALAENVDSLEISLETARV